METTRVHNRMPTDLAVSRPADLASWDGAAERGLRARQEREKIITRVLIPDVHYGIIPGTGDRTKTTLLKAGAEAIVDCLELAPEYQALTAIEDFDRGLFFYRYMCRLATRGGGVTVATGIGSCSSRESKYRWRKAGRKCPECGVEAIITGKQEYGGGFVCFKKKGGCGAKFPDDDQAITSQSEGRVENEDIADVINTIDKMAQKRSLVAAALNLGFSSQFTQDMEDLSDAVEARDKKQKAAAATATATAVSQTQTNERTMREELGRLILELNDGNLEASSAHLEQLTTMQDKPGVRSIKGPPPLAGEQLKQAHAKARAELDLLAKTKATGSDEQHEIRHGRPVITVEQAAKMDRPFKGSPDDAEL